MRQTIIRALTGAAAFLFLTAATAPSDTALKAAISGGWRIASNSVRDGARHPYETLTFWGLKPGQNIVEIEPGGGYWTEILANYAKRTSGAYAGTEPDLTGPTVTDEAKKYFADFHARFSNATTFGRVRWATWDPKSGELGPPSSADLVITARNVHNWMWEPGELDKVLKDCFTVLKPGGLLGVEDHRADPRKQIPEARDGYVNTAFIVAAVEKAGFKFEASSEINGNPKDTKDYPFGVWTLPPTNERTPPASSWTGRPDDSKLLDPAAYQAIGESDRMTLRFRKPF